MALTLTYPERLRLLSDQLGELERDFNGRLRRWQEAQRHDEHPNLHTFISQAVLDGTGLTASVTLPENEPPWNFFHLVDEGDGEPWSHVAFFAGCTDVPCAASLIGFEWHSEIEHDIDALREIAARCFFALRQLAPHIARPQQSASRASA